MKNEFIWDSWQQEVLDYKGDITIRAGRQVGKSAVIAKKAADFAKTHENCKILVIAAAQRQSGYLFEKIKAEIDLLVDEGLLKYYDEPTLTRIRVYSFEKSEYSTIYSLPAGRTGYFIRGETFDLIICDEAAYIPEIVWNSILPMLAVSRKTRGLGNIILLSTPFGKGGYFFESHHDKDFKQFHISSEDCPRIDKLFLAKEKRRMSKQEYAQEYLGQFIDDWRQYFSTELIKKCMTFIEWNFDIDFSHHKNYYLGVDIARYGEDDNAFVICEMAINKKMKIVKTLTTNRVSLTDTMGRIVELDRVFNFNKIFIDDAGIGGGVYDVLKGKFRHRLIGLNNAKRSLEIDRKKALLKEDLYSNALVLMESGLIDIIADLELLKSMKSMIYEYNESGTVKIHGSDSHLTEAFVRACWCIRERGLRPYIA